ncbi:hypothetical protein AYI69_g10818 [Smittium culicis]|uniref:Thermolabile hemolysin n=1 Tax=Smittium culicis TaxID=133412 RepID=A0A1R1X381_9FUNG|nr:hypothetical protein AYI69_g10818 [Smittium culicis]
MKFGIFCSLSVFALTPVLAAPPSMIAFGDNLITFDDYSNSDSGMPYYKGGRTNGPVWSQYASYFSGRKLISYAVSNSVSNNTFILQNANVTVEAQSFIEQVNSYKKTFDGINKDGIANDTVIISAGFNDIMLLQEKIIQNPPKYLRVVDKIADTIIEGINKLEDMGYLNFIVTTIPRFSILPKFASLPIRTGLGLDYVTDYVNIKLLRYLYGDKYNRQKTRKNFVLDFFGFNNNYMAEKRMLKSVGVTNYKSACYDAKSNSTILPTCKDPRSFFFFDDINPTTVIHALYGAITSDILNGKNFIFTNGYYKKMIDRYNINSIYTNSTELNYLNSTVINAIDELSMNRMQAVQASQSIFEEKNQF